MKKIAILYGGKSGEHEVSLRSGGSVLSNLDRSRFEPVLIGIDHEGAWYLQEQHEFETDGKTLRLEAVPEKTVSVVPGRGLYCEGEKLELDLVFPVVHGTFGEDGTLQGALEIAGVPYAGARVLGSALGMDKGVAKKIWMNDGLPVVPFVTVRKGETEKLKNAVKEFGYPVFVKPSNAGSSVGVSKADNEESLSEALTEGFRFDTVLLVEPAVIGREIECAVTGNNIPVSYSAGEIVAENYYDYDSKYIHPDTVGLLIPADISAEEKAEIKRIAEAAYKSACVEGFARVDFFIEKKSGKILLNEINTIPGFTEISMFSKLCQESGYSYSDILSEIIKLAMERDTERKKLSFRKD